MVNQRKPLQIGYLMQADSVPMSVVSGPQLHVEAVVKGLQQRGHQVRTVAIQEGEIKWSDDLVCWHPASFGSSRSSVFRNVERVIRGTQSRLHLPFLRLFDSYRYSDACVNALVGCDILYERCGILSYGGILAAKRMGIPIMLELNGDLIEEYAQLDMQLSNAQLWIIQQNMLWMYRSADQLIPVSATLRQRLIDRWHVNPAQVKSVENGADVEAFLHPAELADKWTHFLYGDKRKVILICSFEPWHGVDLLLDAFALVTRSLDDVELLLVGDGRLRPEMLQKAMALDIAESVRFLGRVDHGQVASLLSIADVAVIAQKGSLADTALSPLKLFEYMAAGKAIVAPALPHIENIVTHYKTAYLVDPGDAEAFASAIVELLTNDQLRAALGDAAQQQAIAKHSWKQTVVQIESQMYELLDEH